MNIQRKVDLFFTVLWLGGSLTGLVCWTALLLMKK